MSIPVSQPEIQLLLYAHQGYRLSDGEREALEAAGWARSLPRSFFPLLRRSRLLSWELMRLEERRRDRLPSSHPAARLVERVPALRGWRERDLEALSREIEWRERERAEIQRQLPPVVIDERDRLPAYRPVSETQAIRLTDEGRKALCALRFSPAADPASAAPLEARIGRWTAMRDAVAKAPWWQARLRAAPDLRPHAERDALWLSAILSSQSPAEVDEAIDAAGSLCSSLARHHLWRLDPLPICLVLLGSGAPRPVDALVETNNALAGFGLGVGVSILGAAAVLVAGSPAPDLAHRIIEFHRLWRALIAHGLAFSDGLMPAAARLAVARRPAEKTALLLREFDNRTTRFDRVDDRTSRIAATLLADLAIDFRDRGDGHDLFSPEAPYVLRMIRRYRDLRTAMTPRCGFAHPGRAEASLLAALLASCPGTVDQTLDRFDATRRMMADHGLDTESASLVATAMDSQYAEEWGVEHSRFVWDLYFATGGGG